MCNILFYSWIAILMSFKSISDRAQTPSHSLLMKLGLLLKFALWCQNLMGWSI